MKPTSQAVESVSGVKYISPIDLVSIRDNPERALMAAEMWNPKAELTLKSIKRIRIA